jgi:hypothetical protein
MDLIFRNKYKGFSPHLYLISGSGTRISFPMWNET